MSITITSAPLRIGIVGGGSDLPEFYEHDDHGSTLSMAINKRVYVVLQSKQDVFTERFRLNYYLTEHVDTRALIRNDIVRATFEYLDFDEPSYISVFSDLPSSSGLGSSSSFCVALVRAIFSLRNLPIGTYDLIRISYHIERTVLNRKIGLQDLVTAGYGGFSLYQYFPSEQITVRPIPLNTRSLETLISKSKLLYLGNPRDAGVELTKVFGENQTKNIEHLRSLRDLAEATYSKLTSDLFAEGAGDPWVTLLQESARIKSQMSKSDIDDRSCAFISNDYKPKAFKLCGAGNGGFALLYDISCADRELQDRLIEFRPDPVGCNVLFSA